MSENERIITDFLCAFGRMDADELIGYFAPDAIYHNIPLPVLRGREEIYESLKGLPNRFKEMRIEILHQVSAGNLVMNERIDYFTILLVNPNFDNFVPTCPVERLSWRKSAPTTDWFSGCSWPFFPARSS